LAHNADPAVRAAWLEDMFLPPDVLGWALNVVVVRNGGRTILIDAGLGADPDLNLPRAGRLVQRLEAAGIDLASVTDVVLTHLHMDHIGGLLADGVRDRLRPTIYGQCCWVRPGSLERHRHDRQRDPNVRAKLDRLLHGQSQRHPGANDYPGCLRRCIR
jgi:glyoxylase-like metal-dependent hydrolase (beta-lactamase superfamily II)